VDPRPRRREGRIQQERRTGAAVFEHVDLVHELELVAGHEPRAIHEVRRPDRPLAGAQVGDGDRPDFFES
jgi:hypothetical protein